MDYGGIGPQRLHCAYGNQAGRVFGIEERTIAQEMMSFAHVTLYQLMMSCCSDLQYSSSCWRVQGRDSMCIQVEMGMETAKTMRQIL